MEAKYTVKKVDISGITAKISKIKKDDTLGKFAASEAARMMQPYVPERDSVLINATIKPWKIVYNVPYARYQYEGVSSGGKALNYTKPTATSHWDRKLNKDTLARALTNYLKR